MIDTVTQTLNNTKSKKPLNFHQFLPGPINVSKPGECPAVPEDSVGVCAQLCEDDSSCTDSQKCCSNGCGTACQKPGEGA